MIWSVLGIAIGATGIIVAVASYRRNTPRLDVRYRFDLRKPSLIHVWIDNNSNVPVHLSEIKSAFDGLRLP